jgi:hypothetical protein
MGITCVCAVCARGPLTGIERRDQGPADSEFAGSFLATVAFRMAWGAAAPR